jgi:hypothetical protein
MQMKNENKNELLPPPTDSERFSISFKQRDCGPSRNDDSLHASPLTLLDKSTNQQINK